MLYVRNRHDYDGKCNEYGKSLTYIFMFLFLQPYQIRPEAIDKKFFTTTTPQFHVKGINKGGMPRVHR